MKKALVAGGAGFIGSNLCERLMSQDYFVFCVDNLYTGRLQNISKFKNNDNFAFINCNVVNLSELEVDEIYNLACPASPLHYQSNPIYTLNTSVFGTIHLATLAQKLKVRMFHASTSEVYGDPTVHPQPEHYYGNVNPFGPRACYDEGKRAAETTLFILNEQQPFDIKIGRIFNTYGPNMSPDDGRVVSNFVNQALRGENITIYGQGTQTRSLCYIDDLIDAMQLFMATDQAVTGPINLGNNAEYTILEIAHKILELTGSSSKIIYSPLPKNDPSRRQPDITLAKHLLGWHPTISLEAGLIKTIAYYQKLMNQGK